VLAAIGLLVLCVLVIPEREREDGNSSKQLAAWDHSTVARMLSRVDP
jgi:hypothetical protein